MRTMRPLHAAAWLFAALWMIGCTPPPDAYRRVYGPGPWDWEVRNSTIGDQGLVDSRPAYARYDYDYRRAYYRDAQIDIGRPEPKVAIEPAERQRDLDKIPDVPTVIEPPR